VEFLNDPVVSFLQQDVGDSHLSLLKLRTLPEKVALLWSIVRERNSLV